MANQIQDCHEYPMIVHCSAGVGRTGTFMAIDSIVKDVKANLLPGIYYENPSDSFHLEVEKLSCTDIVSLTVNHLRRQRVSSVQSFEQFNLVFLALQELFK